MQTDIWASKGSPAGYLWGTKQHPSFPRRNLDDDEDRCRVTVALSRNPKVPTDRRTTLSTFTVERGRNRTRLRQWWLPRGANLAQMQKPLEAARSPTPRREDVVVEKATNQLVSV